MHSMTALLTLCGVATGVVAAPNGDTLENIPVETLEADFRQIEMNIDSGAVIASEIIGQTSSGTLDGRDQIQEVVWSEIVRVEDAAWLRLEFDQVDLASATSNARESYLRVTSLLDGYEQYLDFEALQVWGNTTAYFNGNAVRVEIMASPNSTRVDRVVIGGVQASPSVSPASICFSTDDRVPSNDPRDGRLMPIGCSAWLFSDHGSTFLTAAHCNPSGGNVMQFNVPFSTNGGGYQNPPPQDQYVLDGASVQATPGTISLGNDWGFFGVFDNTDTGLTPLQAQGDSHNLATSTIPNDGRPIRITGYGTTSAPISPTWNGIQKTHVGPFQGYSGNVVRYTTDTTGGNSGSVILDDNNNQAIGIHTNAGCGSGGGWNNGCNLFNAGLQNALANPLGIAAPRTIQADVSPAPDFVSPDGGDMVQLIISNDHDRTIIGTPTLFVDSGSGFQAIASSFVNATTYEAPLPAVDCGTDLFYYFQISDTDGNTTQYPEAGELAPLSTIALDELTIAVEDDFQTPAGWTTIDIGVTAGNFERQAPIDTTNNGGPSFDADGSGVCFITGRGIFEDLDGGTTQAVSNFYDATAVEDAVVSFWAWVNTEDDERLIVEFSPNVGINWFPVDEIDDTNGWEIKRYRIADYVEPTQIFKMRVTIADEGADSLVEAGIDGFMIASQVCGADCAADFEEDGSLNFLDVSAFLAAYGIQDPSADLISDGNFNFLDVSEFLAQYAAGCP
jgi:V8-like Glu-specific endopeptidase